MHNARHTVRLSLRAEALTVDGRYTTMISTKADQPPWPPLRLSMKLQSLHNEVQDQFYELGAGRASQRTFRYLHPVYHGSVCPKLRVPAETCQNLPGPRIHSLRRTGKKTSVTPFGLAFVPKT